ncbi:monosaccharide ABC transporter substrate-binding protein (CUT2 family) [Lachnotalea glycerini]|uniref:Monosaccharide ABC transporter substrate-binding protein (CUT2 family) n=1 Tax=Lachnotalea glycerini TaxID=1763509 RepID=A0A318EPP6_9FIRM|nr:sugar ABC transporter substrate-binding protein [Lachnotalea glycerini]PXV93441.1 monosaccharide ABC transporter substrate-binding protein (CUT2 family) [Lachnotalea glycerini]RDY31830.1 sugar ABC transporter substrate-binding protein [Lachnotalea glycerini]
MKKILALSMALMLTASLAACGSKDTTEDTTKDTTTDTTTDTTKDTTTDSTATTTDSDIKVGVILKTLSSEYWGYVAAGVKQAATDLGVTVDLQGPSSETAYDEQNNMIETMLSDSDLDALVISPLQPDSVVSVLGDTTTPILFVDTDAPYDKKVTYIGTGNKEAAYLGGEYAAKKAGEGAKAVIIGGVQGNTTSDAREAGFKEALEANGVTIEATQYGEGLADKSSSIMENLLTSLNNDIDIVVCHNDETAAGAARAVQQAGLTDVLIVGFDGIQAGVQNVIDGNFAATVAQSPYNMGYMAVEKAVAVAKGETVEATIDTGATVVTSENAQAYLDELKSVLNQ